MARGGKRPGAGRPRIEKRAPGPLAKAAKLIDKAQPWAAKALVEALGATTAFPRIIGRDDKGHPEYEYVQVPDHNVRVKAASVLHNKRIPDLSKIQHEGGDDDKPVRILAKDEVRKLPYAELVRRLAEVSRRK